ncbi:hypothetical protein ACVIIV_003365 [Bradyrhizobium sp. USDA 4354]
MCAYVSAATCESRRKAPRAFAIRESISEERCDDPADASPKQRIYQECGQRPQVPPPLRLEGATIRAVMLDRWVLWCAPMCHFITRRAGPRKNARLCMPRITHKFAVPLSKHGYQNRCLLRGEHPADDMLAHRRYTEVAFRHHSNLHATTEKCRRRFARLSELATRSPCPWSGSRRRRLKDNTRVSSERGSASRAPYRKQCVRSWIVVTWEDRPMVALIEID